MIPTPLAPGRAELVRATTASLRALRDRIGLSRVLAVDCPWWHASNSDAKPGKNPRGHYPCMKVPELAALPIGELATDDATLFLWIPGPQLVRGNHLPLLAAWGFKPSGKGFTWVKTTKRADLTSLNAARQEPPFDFKQRRNAKQRAQRAKQRAENPGRTRGRLKLELSEAERAERRREQNLKASRKRRATAQPTSAKNMRRGEERKIEPQPQKFMLTETACEASAQASGRRSPSAGDIHRKAMAGHARDAVGFTGSVSTIGGGANPTGQAEACIRDRYVIVRLPDHIIPAVKAMRRVNVDMQIEAA
jgi:hypothetical protein